MTHRTRWCVVDVHRTDAGCLQLEPGCDAQIDVAFLRAGNDKTIRVAEDGAKLADDLIADLKTAGANRWSKAANDLPRLGAKLGHSPNDRNRNLTDGAAPSRVGGAANTGFAVCEHKRHAIGGECPQNHARLVRDQSIEFRRLGQRLIDAPNGGAMDMFGNDQLGRIVARRFGNAASVFLDVLGLASSAGA